MYSTTVEYHGCFTYYWYPYDCNCDFTLNVALRISRYMRFIHENVNIRGKISRSKICFKHHHSLKLKMKEHKKLILFSFLFTSFSFRECILKELNCRKMYFHTTLVDKYIKFSRDLKRR